MRTVYPQHVYCVINGEPQNLPWGEFKLLMALVASAGRWMSRKQLEEQIYGRGAHCHPSAVAQLVHRMRVRIGRHLILNRFGKGYMVK